MELWAVRAEEELEARLHSQLSQDLEEDLTRGTRKLQSPGCLVILQLLARISRSQILRLTSPVQLPWLRNASNLTGNFKSYEWPETVLSMTWPSKND
uniref:Uncharacterized protein n=1 Tax=Sphaerodactylus townsendi TaxID=933632 RepID=A0ACB8F240_9SAUR